LQDGQLALRIFFGVAEENIVPAGVGHMLHTAHHIGEERIGNIGHYQADRARMLGSQAARNAAGPIA
jgi:hypothetical protein